MKSNHVMVLSKFLVVITPIVAGASLGGTGAQATPGGRDLDQAPPAFSWRDAQAVPIDIESVELELTFDTSSQSTVGHARVIFDQAQSGYPFFDMVPGVSSVALNGVALNQSDFVSVSAPGGITQYRVIAQKLTADDSHVLDIVYSLTNGVSFYNGAARAGFFMDDLSAGGRGFWEQYAPANLEFDHYKQYLTIKVIGSSKEHILMVNGAMTVLGPNSWSVEYPDWYNTSSFYLHLFEKGRFVVRTSTYQGVEKSIALTTYASSSSDADSGMSRARQVMAENEATFGPYTHAGFIAYVTPDGGGMEHCGATMTSLRALGHELTHSWFARGVMPADGNAGWIDEAVASWRDAGYPRSGMSDRTPVNLGGFSVYKRETTRAAYSEGKQLLSEFDGLWASAGGLRPILKALFAERKRTTITVGYLKSFFESTSGQNLDAIFNRYVFGKSSREIYSIPDFQLAGPDLRPAIKSDVWHPRPYTKEELNKYR